MAQAITTPNNQMSPHAPKMIRLKINPDKIGALIGPGGRVIRGIQEETGTNIDVQDDGTVTIGGVDQTMLEMAHSKVDSLTRELAVGDIFTGKVVRLTNFGAFVELVPGRDGLIRNGDLGDLEEDLTEGQEITVMIHEIDSQGRVNLSRRALFGDDSPPAPRPEGARSGFDRRRTSAATGGGRNGGFNGGPWRQWRRRAATATAVAADAPWWRRTRPRRRPGTPLRRRRTAARAKVFNSQAGKDRKERRGNIKNNFLCAHSRLMFTPLLIIPLGGLRWQRFEL